MSQGKEDLKQAESASERKGKRERKGEREKGKERERERERKGERESTGRREMIDGSIESTRARENVTMVILTEIARLDKDVCRHFTSRMMDRRWAKNGKDFPFHRLQKRGRVKWWRGKRASRITIIHAL